MFLWYGFERHPSGHSCQHWMIRNGERRVASAAGGGCGRVRHVGLDRGSKAPAESPRFWYEGSRNDTVPRCRGLTIRIHPLIITGADIIITRCDFKPDRRSAMETCSGMHRVHDCGLRRKPAVDIDLWLQDVMDLSSHHNFRHLIKILREQMWWLGDGLWN